MPARIFISYRRKDSAGTTGRIADFLKQEFGEHNVFYDLDSIEGGEDFAAAIIANIRQSHIVLVVMGPRWVGFAPDGARRIDDIDDSVRLEVRTALGSAHAQVLPVLVDGAEMSAAGSLPADIAAISGRHAATVSDRRFRSDMADLKARINRLTWAQSTYLERTRHIVSQPAVIVGLALILIASTLTLPPVTASLLELPVLQPLRVYLSCTKPGVPMRDGSFNIIVAGLNGDDNRLSQTLNVAESLARQLTINEPKSAVRVKRHDCIISESGSAEMREASLFAQARARSLLTEQNANVLIWGRVVQRPGQEKGVVRINFIARDNSGDMDGTKYQLNEYLELDPRFGTELLARAIMGTAATAFEGGRPMSDVLRPGLKTLAALAENPPPDLSLESKIWLQQAYALAVLRLGEEMKGDVKVRVETLRKAEAMWLTIARQPILDAGSVIRRGSASSWAGLAQKTISEALVDRDALRMAIQSYRTALQDLTPDTFASRKPWAKANLGLADALQSLGEWDEDATPLREAIKVNLTSIAVMENHRDDLRGDLGRSLSAMGDAYSSLANLEPQPLPSIEAGIAALRASLQLLDPAAERENWGSAHSNLGNALRMAGERGNRSADLAESIKSFEQAAKALPMDVAPGLWLLTRLGKGEVLRILGSRERDGTVAKSQLKEAIAILQDALKHGVAEEEEQRLTKVRIKRNFAAALKALAVLERDAQLLVAATLQINEVLEILQDGDDATQATGDWVASQAVLIEINLASGEITRAGATSSTKPAERALELSRALHRRILEKPPNRRDWSYDRAQSAIMIARAVLQIAEGTAALALVEEARALIIPLLPLLASSGSVYLANEAKRVLGALDVVGASAAK